MAHPTPHDNYGYLVAEAGKTLPRKTLDGILYDCDGKVIGPIRISVPA